MNPSAVTYGSADQSLVIVETHSLVLFLLLVIALLMKPMTTDFFVIAGLQRQPG